MQGPLKKVVVEGDSKSEDAVLAEMRVSDSGLCCRLQRHGGVGHAIVLLVLL